MSLRIADYFSEPLLDLGVQTPELHGIRMPASEAGRERVGVTDQFLERAADYHARYTDVAYFKVLLGDAFERVDVPPRAVVLDVGSGSGNSVFGCLDLLPDAHVVATDISPDLLAILRDCVAAQESWRGRVTPVCLSAASDCYRPGRFDLAVGAAILHHLIDPGAALRAIGRALAPDACAIFFEPFENGNAILRLAYADLLERARREGDSAHPGFAALEGLARDYEIRMGEDKSAPLFARIDDKWLFTRSLFERWAEEGGFRSLEIEPLHALDAPFGAQTRINLKLAAGLGPEALPDWCWQRLARLDESFSPALKRDLLVEGRVILRK